MASNFIQLPPNSTGLKVDTSELTVGANTVERENLCIADPTTAANIASVTAANALKVDGSAVTQPVSGTVSVSGNVGVTQQTTPWTIQGDSASGAAKAGNPVQAGGVFNTTQPTVTTGQTVEAQATARGALIVATGVDTFTVATSGTTTVAGTVTANQGTANATPWNENIAQVGGNAVSTSATGQLKVGIVGNAGAVMDAAGQNAASPANELLVAGQFNTSPTAITSGNISPLQLTSAARLIVDGSQVTQPVSGTVTANAGSGTFTTSDSHFPTSAALSDALANPTTTEVGANILAWDATNSVWRRVQVDAGTGTLKVDGSGSTQPVSGTVTANQGTNPWTDNVSQFGGSNVVTGTGAGGAGIPRVTVSNDSNILATQSGTWTVQQGGAPWSQNLTQVAGTALGATAVTNYGTAPAAAAVPGVNAFVTNTVAENVSQVAGVAVTGQVAGSLPVTIVSGAGSGGTAMADEGAFTQGTTNITPAGGIYTGLSNVPVLTAVQAGALQVTADRKLVISSPQEAQIVDLLGTLIQEIRAMRTALVYMVTENGDVRDLEFNPDNTDFLPVN